VKLTKEVKKDLTNEQCVKLGPAILWSRKLEDKIMLEWKKISGYEKDWPIIAKDSRSIAIGAVD